MSHESNESIKIHAEISAKLNFAAHQSSYALLHDLRIENTSEDQPLENLVLTLKSDPHFIEEKSWPLDRISAKEAVSVQDRDIQISGEFLRNLAETTRGSMSFLLTKDEVVLAELVKPVELLAYNEWGGADFMPELLAAFCMPNDPSVDRIIHDASEVLRRAGKSSQIDGYQSQSCERVWEIAAAIYSAVVKLGLTYATPPRSFEKNGQKVRLPNHIISNKTGTCLDTAMLFASALEQVGLNPVVALPEGHALAGVWLQPEEFSSIVVEDAEILRKRIDLKELLLFETTYVTSSSPVAFSQACTSGLKAIHPSSDETFTCAVDIRQARAHRITPLALKVKTAHEEEAVSTVTELPLEEPPPLPGFTSNELEEEKPTTPEGRLERWQRRLLDLTLNNRLLNHRSTKTTLQIICPKPGRLEDKLASGSQIRIIPVPSPTSQEQDQEIHRQRTGEEITEEYALEQLEHNCVLVSLSKDELDKRAVGIYRKTQTALQEGGANTLYLALGFLLWKKNEKDPKRCRAPLILLPVTLTRKSVRSGIRMSSHDDEPRFNTTLLEMLRKDFRIDLPSLDGDLPTDESGIDVDGIWLQVRMAVKDAPGFEVVEDVALGHFSFAKYLMWKDLADRTDALRENAVVRHLLDTPREPYDSKTEFIKPQEIDKTYKPSDLFMPLSADASQAAAIATADRGKDFIIIGPPGTGKSQTIANLIAHMLGKGKLVLFVSEKTAALEVVHRRLKEIGLGHFCLELHSNKAKKADVLRQLAATWQLSAQKSEDDWHREAENLLELRGQLNLIVNHLHKKHRNGLTPYYAVGVKIRDELLADRLKLSWPSAQQHDESTLEKMRGIVEKLAIQAKEIDDLSASPFQLIEEGKWTPGWEGEIVEQAEKLATLADRTRKNCSTLCEVIGLPLSDQSIIRLNALIDLTSLLADSYRQPTAYALEPNGQDQIDAFKEAIERLKAYAHAQASLSCSYDAFAWRSLDGEAIARRWLETTTMWWPKRFLTRRRIIKEIQTGGAQGKPNPEHDAKLLSKLRENGEVIDRLDQQLSSFKEWAGHSTESAVAESLHQLGERARIIVAKLAEKPDEFLEIRKQIQTLLHEGNDLLAPEGNIRRVATDFAESYEELQNASDQFEAMAGGSVSDIFANEVHALEELQKVANNISERKHEIRAWCDWRRRRLEAVDIDLLPLVEAVEQGHVSPGDMQEVFEAAYCTWWSSAIIEEDEVLRSFSSPEHERQIEKFCEADGRFQKLTAQYIAAKLAGKLPEQGEVKKSSQWGIIRHEIQKKMRHKPVRRLLGEAPEVMTTLAPCFMMSPLSVAQYLPPDQRLFDVVIFDEASQITVWDAVGAIARGKQVITAGDPKQMPPTNFFARADNDPDGMVETEGDLESILDEMLGAGIPQCTLNLHYRSRRESLISFSNDRYYDNTLITFPAPDVKDNAVRLVRPEGFYARGDARHNESEAKAIVGEIIARLTHENPDIRQRSIGVVTFNSEQQTLIEDLLDKARLERPEIEMSFSQSETNEPVFVKNLETVQGDERDVILFSITYGPDRNDHMVMNFGPLNRQGGERRLNVAMTRARIEMIVFSTLSPDRIDLSRSQALAVKHLKQFLEYAEKGASALKSTVQGSVGDFESPFESAVSRELKVKGWEVHPQIGVSAYRIDLGVVHPDQRGRYLAGIECDGAMYHSSATARERDKIRQSVLEGLGWTLFRIWSTDWWTHKEKALEKVDQALHKYLDADRQREKRHVNTQAEESLEKSVKDIPDPHSANSGQPPLTGKPNQTGTTLHASNEQGIHPNTENNGKQKPDSMAQLVDEEDDHPPLVGNNHDYIEADLNKGDIEFEPDVAAFYSDAYKHRLNAMLDYVIDIEGPIHEDVLVRKIALHHGFRRAGGKIKDIIIDLAKKRRGSTREKVVGTFFWAKGTVKHRVTPHRHRNRNSDLRKIEHICSEELRAISKALSLNGDAVKIARALGIARLSESARNRIEKAVYIQTEED
ncbi:MAG: DUF3320 domain-containing protein [Gammaproteobacteria bacterium]|nr:DUF3320 domain-containing protein [Gammaproteobacteria bacterium]